MPIKIQENISLSKYTSFKIGGPSRYFCAVENIDEIREALEFAKKNELNIFVLGGGSNLLVADSGFNGLIIKIQNSKFKIQNSNIICDSGLSLAKLVSESVKNNFIGLEWAAGIPGTVGGAICNNAGAYGKSMEDAVEEVEAIEIIPTGKSWRVEKLAKQKCNFTYRNSIFKSDKKYIILSTVLKLEKGNEAESRKMVLKYLKARKEKQPLEYPSAGSVFKNPKIEGKKFKQLLEIYLELSTMEVQPRYTIPAGWFTEALGLKGKKIGGAMVSEKHGNFIVNTGNAKAEDVVILISLIKQKVRDNFGVQLREEIEYVGF